MSEIIIKKTKKKTGKKSNIKGVKYYYKYHLEEDEEHLERHLQNINNQLEKEKDKDLIKSYQNEINAIYKIIEDRLYQQYNELNSKKTDFEYYPDLLDPNFNEKIYLKKEFNENQITIPSYDINELADKRCNPTSYNLSNTQILLKNFISNQTPYNGLLLWHGTGVGKTCTAISIAEQFKELIAKENKKIIVLLSPSIKDNFKKQLFNVDKIKDLDYKKIDEINKQTIPQCTGNSYLEKMDNIVIPNKEFLEKKINRIINSYYQFAGYDSFANYVTKLEEKAIKGYPEEKHELLKRKMLHKYFSNTMLIIDEAHHIRLSGSNVTTTNGGKIAPPMIEKVIKASDNLKLLLLTATPMYNSQYEILWLLNLLLQNDKRPTIQTNDIFDNEGNLREKGIQTSKQKSTGYISYLRAENPYAFPFRLYPSVNQDKRLLTNDKIPIFNMKNKILPDEYKLKYLELISSNMSEFQYQIYKKSVSSLLDDKINEEDEDTESQENDIEDEEKDKGYSEIEKGLQTSNIIFPNISLLNEDINEIDNPNYFYGSRGFNNVFNSKLTKQGRTFSYKDEILNNFGPFLISSSLNKDDVYQFTLKDFSTKMDSIIEYINNSKGIVYIYSQFITSGVLPLALALEQNGFKKYGDSRNQLLNIPDKYKPEPISYEGKLKSEYQNPADFKQANYILITGRDDISKNNDLEVYNSTLSNNKYGEEIKVILGSPVAGEGLDMKRLREIHILEPWFHLNRLEQVIGRGIRNCSHQDLPLSERNCTIYMHVSNHCDKPEYIQDINKETIDIRVYRKAEYKTIQISKIEEQLKKNAIDCLLNKKGNIFLPEEWNQQIEIETSQKIVTTYTIGDKPYSRLCNYKENCDYQCYSETDRLYQQPLNYDTYDIDFATNKLKQIISYITQLYKKDFIFNLKDIVEYVNDKMETEEIYIYQAIDDMIHYQDKYTVIDRYDREGYVIYRGGYYIFQPKEIKNQNIPLYYRNKPLFTKKKRVPLIDNYQIRRAKEIKKTQKMQYETKIYSYQSVMIDLEKHIKRNINILKDDDFWVNVIKDEYPILHKILIDFFIDRINIKEKTTLLTYLFNKIKMNLLDDTKIKDILNDEEFLIFQSLKYYFLINNVDLQKKPLKKSPDYIIGFRIMDTNDNEIYYYLLDDKLTKYIKKDRFITLENKYKQQVEIDKENTIFGYMDKVKQRDQYLFKLVNKINKETIKKKKITGAVCSQMNSKDSIGKLINIIFNKTKYEKKNLVNYGKVKSANKQEICHYLELLLRYNQIKNINNKTWFYRDSQKYN